ncbi:MmcQ-like protein [bacterium 336/3]|jgi:predicted DNA-binding protein (MmcQ/YjbR family)|nr:MmcQ-like protein [bacterium 336/3]
MDIEDFRNYCIKKKGVTEEFPFDNVTLVFKVMGKMFALTGLDREVFSINLKCEPEKAVELREQYDGVRPGYHMNKKHWNTILVESIKPQKLVLEWIDDSYNLVVASLTKKLQDELKSLS